MIKIKRKPYVIIPVQSIFFFLLAIITFYVSAKCYLQTEKCRKTEIYCLKYYDLASNKFMVIITITGFSFQFLLESFVALYHSHQLCIVLFLWVINVQSCTSHC